MSWQQVQLGEVADIISGATPKSTVPDFWGGEIAWATPTDLSNLKAKHIASTERRITDAGLKSCAARLLPPNSVLFSSRAPIGLVAINQTPMATNQGFKSFVPSEDLNSDYLYWWLVANKQQIQDLGNGATFKEVSKAIVSNVKIPLPPVGEQRRIAKILDKADAIRRKRQQALALADDFLKSVFLEMFGDPVQNPKAWNIGTVDDCLLGTVGGWSAKGDARPASDNEVGVLKISAVTSGQYLPSENKTVTSIPDGKQLIIPRKGNLLFSRANTRELVAATCIVHREAGNVFLPDKLWRLDPNEKRALNPYLKFVFSHKKYREILCEKASGTSGSMLNISKAKLMAHSIPIPPLDLQRDFSSIYWRTIASNEATAEAANESERLFASLSQRAFRGEL
ncbi:restriction endonuclease subunit S [Microbulbifer sp. S227A]|uniref:restriction endonuclease subunit S n=1 Tax=Microbulbifer sp. S227A TaxID=3415131 RepID=UPI003C7A034B